MTALVLEWQRVDAVRVGWVPPPVGQSIPAAIVGPPGVSGDASPREPVIAPGTTAQYWRGDKSWATLDKGTVGLGNAENTSDTAKPISTATQTALDGKQPLAAVLTATSASFTSAKDSKLSGIAIGATANSPDATLLTRSNHTGTQTASTISDFAIRVRAEAEAELVAGSNVAIVPSGSGAARILTISALPGSADPMALANAPTVPGAGTVRVGERTIANEAMLAWRTSQSGERLAQPHLSRTGYFWRQATINSGTPGSVGLPNATAVGGAGRTIASTSIVTRAYRHGFASTAVAGTLGSYYCSSNNYALIGAGGGLGGFRFVFATSITDPAAVVGARSFVGLRASTTAPTNVNPAALTNVVGLAQIDGSGNMNIVYGGSAAQTPIDLGASFPAGNTASIDVLTLYSDPLDSGYLGYQVDRFTTSSVTPSATISGTIANTTPGTTLPATSTALSDAIWRTNNTTALVASIDFIRVVYMFDL